MRITRFLLPGCLLVAFAGPGAAQYSGARGSPYQALIPSVLPVGAEEPQSPMNSQGPGLSAPSGRPPMASSLEQMTAPQHTTADPMGTLTGQPATNMPGLPPGSYPSPYYVEGPGCCGPLGTQGRIGYEVYDYGGVNFVMGPGLAHYLNAGWTVGGGARTLLFDSTHTAAWTIDLGLSYTHNYGAGGSDPTNLFIRQSPLVNTVTGVVAIQPDRLALTGIRGIHRLSFNYNIGRDIWLMGSGATGSMETTNVRVGGWVGGRYGTSHIDMVPMDQINSYSRRQNVYEGIVVGGHVTFDIPMGSWVFFGGLRAEYGYDWMNLAPPIQGNLQNINLQITTGIRF